MPKAVRYVTLCALSALAFAAPLAAMAGNDGMQIKCWTDKHGVRECGNAIPPEYSQGAAETINGQGLTVQTQQAAQSKGQLEKEAQQQAQARAKAAREKKRAAAQARYDRTLLATFDSEKEITATRDRNIAAINANISVTRITMQRSQAKLDDLQQRAARFERAGKPAPKPLQQEIADAQSDIASKQAYIRSQENEKTRLRKVYAGYLKRFTELKGEGEVQ